MVDLAMHSRSPSASGASSTHELWRCALRSEAGLLWIRTHLFAAVNINIKIHFRQSPKYGVPENS